MIRLVQLLHPVQGRRIALVEEPRLRIVDSYNSIYDLAAAAMKNRQNLAKMAATHVGQEQLEYDAIYRGESEWRLLPAFDHPQEPACCLVTGTGLTHKKSAENRQAMHAAAAQAPTDSMRMYKWGLEGGRPPAGQIGISPEWFYKGCGTILRAHGEPLEVPPFADDGGEEAEVAGIYMIDDSGAPRRVGFAQSNEFSDHVMEQKNYLWLAPSKLRTCSLGPELIVDGEFENAVGTIRIERAGRVIWSHSFKTGECNMSHTVANLEHHHFKYPAHRRPGDAHIHFFGADVFSYGEGVQLADGDVMEIELTGFGRPLRNPIRLDRSIPRYVKVEPI